MITPTIDQRLAERHQPGSPVVMKQVWSHLLFLHWEVEPDIIQKILPVGLTVDTHEDKAYIGIVPFFMEDVRPSYCPAIPGISWFQELNLRTYVHDAQGRPGVWFFTLDCNQWLAVKIARTLFHLPYQHASMESYQDHGTLTYISRRMRSATSQIFRYPAALRQPHTAQPGTLEFFLLERYRLFSVNKAGTIFSGRVHHQPYAFEDVVITDYSTELFPLCGFETPDSPPISAIIAEPVHVDIHPLRKN